MKTMPGKTIAIKLLYKWSHEVVTKKLNAK